MTQSFKQRLLIQLSIIVESCIMLSTELTKLCCF